MRTRFVFAFVLVLALARPARAQSISLSTTQLQGASATVSASPVPAAGTTASSVSFALDNVTICNATAAPWACSFDSTRFANALHVITATMTESDGKTAAANQTVTIANTIPFKIVATLSGNPFSGSVNIAQIAGKAAITYSRGNFALDSTGTANATLCQPTSACGIPGMYSLTFTDSTGKAVGMATIPLFANFHSISLSIDFDQATGIADRMSLVTELLF